MTLPSKELLSKILGTGIPDNLKLYGKTDVTYTFGSNMLSINIYELAHKCKEWSYKNHGLIISKNHRTWRNISLEDVTSDYTDDWEAKGYFYNGDPSKTISKEFICNSEPESIFRACQWILDNKEPK